jgi:hypothetical protein
VWSSIRHKIALALPHPIKTPFPIANPTYQSQYSWLQTQHQ